MKEIAIAILSEPSESNAVHWFENKSYFALMDYVYHSGIRVEDYNEKIKAVLKKKTGDMTIQDIFIYLSFIFGKDRIIDGFVHDHIENGTIRKLMQRFLVLDNTR